MVSLFKPAGLQCQGELWLVMIRSQLTQVKSHGGFGYDLIVHP